MMLVILVTAPHRIFIQCDIIQWDHSDFSDIIMMTKFSSDPRLRINGTTGLRYIGDGTLVTCTLFEFRSSSMQDRQRR